MHYYVREHSRTDFVLGGGGIWPPLKDTKEVLCVQGNSKWYTEYDRETMVQRFQETGFACYDMYVCT